LETPTEEQSDVLQQMQTSGELHSDLNEVSERDTTRGGNSENTLQRVRADNESVKEIYEYTNVVNMMLIYLK
jgi:recombinational DNA repair ATPase RecF